MKGDNQQKTNMTFKTFYFNETDILLEKESKFQLLKKNKKPLTPEERKECLEKKAVWHMNGNNNPTPAVWKSVDEKGKTIYVTHTHRAYNTAPTLKGAIGRFHDFIKGTA